VTKASLTVGGGAGSDVIVDATHDRVTTFDYDGAGRLTASTDAIGTVTAITYDGLSRVVMTQTGDRVTRYLYDKTTAASGSSTHLDTSPNTNMTRAAGSSRQCATASAAPRSEY
jgi:YD repeat-containing protein